MNEYFKTEKCICRIKNNKVYIYNPGFKRWSIKKHVTKKGLFSLGFTQLTLLDLLMLDIPE